VRWRSLAGSNLYCYPLGKDATGYIMYNEDGYMVVAIMAPHRLRFAALPQPKRLVEIMIPSSSGA